MQNRDPILFKQSLPVEPAHLCVLVELNKESPTPGEHASIFKTIHTETVVDQFSCACSVLYDSKLQPTTIIYTFRGKAFSTAQFENLKIEIDSLIINSDKLFQIVDALYQFHQSSLQALETYVGEDYKKLQMMTTGYELGAIVSDIFYACAFFKRYKQFAASITFENPGSAQVIHKLLNGILMIEDINFGPLLKDLKGYCASIQLTPNPFNTAYTQLGETYGPQFTNNVNIDSIQPWSTDESLETSLFHHYLNEYTSAIHSLQYLCNLLQQNTPYELRNNYYSNREAFLAYLDLNTRMGFWKDYLSRQWEINKALQSKYNQNYSTYFESCVSEINKIIECSNKRNQHAFQSRFYEPKRCPEGSSPKLV